MGYFSWIMPVMVAISAFGGLSVHIMTSSRMCFVGARYGHFPAMLSHINVNRYTPTPSLVFLVRFSHLKKKLNDFYVFNLKIFSLQMLLSLIMLCTSDIFVLITYSSIVESFFIMLSVAGILYLRYKKPDMDRPIKVSLIIPITFVIICAFLIVVPCYVAPYEVGMGILITVTGIPCYLIGVKWQKKPAWFLDGLHSATYGVQKLFLSAKEE